MRQDEASAWAAGANSVLEVVDRYLEEWDHIEPAVQVLEAIKKDLKDA